MSNKKEIEKYTKEIWNDTKEYRDLFADVDNQAKELSEQGEKIPTNELKEKVDQILERDPIQKLTEQRKNQPGKSHSERLPGRLRDECYSSYEKFKNVLNISKQMNCEPTLCDLMLVLSEMFMFLAIEVKWIENHAKKILKIDLL